MLSLTEYKEIVKSVLIEICQEKFKESFYELYTDELRDTDGRITKNGCLALYISIFQENDSYIPYLISFMDEFAIDFDEDFLDDLDEIIFELNEMREEISINSHLNELELRLTNDSYFSVQNYTIEDIDELDGIDFELFLQKLFTKLGYTAEITQSTGDQGADLILSKLGRKIAVQAKRYNTKLDNTPIQEVLGAKAYYGCNETMVVTNSYFTKKAIELAHVNQVQLIDRDDLIELLESHPIYKDH